MQKTYLEITLLVTQENRPKAGGVYAKYRQHFLDTIPGALSKELLIRSEDVQVLHGFRSKVEAENYLGSALFKNDVVTALAPYLAGAPEVRIYECA